MLSTRFMMEPLVLGLGLTAAGGLCLYFLTKERESYQVTSRQVELLIEIPRDRVKEVLGRGGSNIREIQVKTDTVIKVRDELETEEHRIVSIRGSPDSTQEAEILIQKTLSQRVGQKEICVVTVPSRTVGRIVGCNGGVIWKIGNKTGCKVEVEVLDHEKSRIHLMGSTDGVHTARNMIQQKVKESDIIDLTFGKIGAFDILTASKKNETYVENIPPKLEDSGVSQVEAPYLSSRHIGLLHLALSCYVQCVDEYVGDVRQTTVELLPSGQVKVTIEKTTYIFLPSFPPDIDFTEDMEPDTMDPVSVQIHTARRLRRMGLDIPSGGVKDIMLAECWLPSQLPSQTKFSCMCWNLDWDMSLTVTTVDQEQILGVISLVLNTVYSGSKPGDRDTNWKTGEDCVAVFPLDGTWNRAKVIALNDFEGKVQVRFVDYGSISWCKEHELRRTLFTQEFPIQSVKLVIEDLVPSDTVLWPRDVLDLLDSCVVGRQLRVELISIPTCFPLVGKVYLGDVDIGKILADTKLAKYKVPKVISSIDVDH